MLWFLQLLHPSGPSGEMKFTDAQALTVTGPQKAAFAKGWNTLADTLPPPFFFLIKNDVNFPLNHATHTSSETKSICKAGISASSII